MTRPLTHADKLAAFTAATRSLIHWYGEEIAAGVTDARLEELLGQALGIFGGSGGPNQISLAFQGAGLKIWACWETVNNVTDKPIFQGKATVKMAREVYNIPDPSNRQLKLL
ncbi:hypothetical protein AWH62_03175 [Maricaulis sp. W15]|uniref:hypothetical protein n=1 Tax=Maricaulis sp. W15 TaxID=1772333 RepID=UPI000948DA84|nr:hypothetical protein [Maricaulis sp. W15]OLF77691.1 hypothetical protein AWH62_03175 [Maricaulis sp. W15]